MIDRHEFFSLLCEASPDRMTLKHAVRWFDNIESPIEQQFAICFVEAALMERGFVHLGKGPFFLITESVGSPTVRIRKQVGINRYRADFVIDFAGYDDPGDRNPCEVVVECDGHAFHEKTKQQAAHDKKRDRILQLVGFDVLRFTGSEIHRNPHGCGGSALTHLMSNAHKGLRLNQLEWQVNNPAEHQAWVKGREQMLLNTIAHLKEQIPVVH